MLIYLERVNCRPWAFLLCFYLIIRWAARGGKAMCWSVFVCWFCSDGKPTASAWWKKGRNRSRVSFSHIAVAQCHFRHASYTCTLTQSAFKCEQWHHQWAPSNFCQAARHDEGEERQEEQAQGMETWFRKGGWFRMSTSRRRRDGGEETEETVGNAGDRRVQWQEIWCLFTIVLRLDVT